REHINEASTCYSWAGMDPTAVGLARVEKDLMMFLSKAKADAMCQEFTSLLRESQLVESLEVLNKALACYKAGDAFKQVTDCQGVKFCLEGELRLRTELSNLIVNHEPGQALKLLDEVKPVMEVAVAMKSKVLDEIPALLGKSLQKVLGLADFCREWQRVLDGAVEAEAENEQEEQPLQPIEKLGLCLNNLRELEPERMNVLEAVSFRHLEEVALQLTQMLDEEGSQDLVRLTEENL
ncbi:unnamed protein product, partial [Chrysoparadoxa australica]